MASLMSRPRSTAAGRSIRPSGGRGGERPRPGRESWGASDPVRQGQVVQTEGLKENTAHVLLPIEWLCRECGCLARSRLLTKLRSGLMKDGTKIRFIEIHQECQFSKLVAGTRAGRTAPPRTSQNRRLIFTDTLRDDSDDHASAVLPESFSRVTKPACSSRSRLARGDGAGGQGGHTHQVRQRSTVRSAATSPRTLWSVRSKPSRSATA